MPLSRAFVLAACAAAIALLLAAYVRNLRSRARARSRQRRGAQGEREAEVLLARAGYRIVGRQVGARLIYEVDQRPITVDVRVDLLVERDGRAFVAEVKTGDRAPSLRSRATRRQLLEYSHAFAAHGLLLIDPERRRIHRVTVPVRAAQRSSLRDLAVLAVGGGLGWLITAAYLADG